MKNKQVDFLKYIKNNTLRLKASRRGGGIEVSIAKLLNSKLDLRMTAYQNYLGGGLLGAVDSDVNFDIKGFDENQQLLINRFRNFLKQYYFNITNEEATDYDEWNEQSYEQNQNMPISAY